MRLSILTSKSVGNKIRYRLSNIFRKKKREDFLNILPKNSVGAEIGVFKGEFSKHIFNIVNPKKLHLIDLWWELGEHFHWGGFEEGGEKLKTRDAYVIAKNNIYQADTRRISTVHVGDDLAYLKEFENGHFDWVYLDSSHKYEHTKNELELLQHKVKPGGLIVGHDFYSDPGHVHHGVYKAVKEFCETHNWQVLEQDSFSQWCIVRK